MMTAAFVFAALAVGVLIGFLAGERRAVKQCNSILDERMQDLLKIMLQADAMPSASADREDEPARATVH